MLIATLPLAFVGTALLASAQMATNPGVNIRRSPGVRTAATLRSREAWLAAHRAVEPHLLIAGYALLAMSPLNALVGAFWDVRYAIVFEFIALNLLLLISIWLIWVADRAARSAP